MSLFDLYASGAIKGSFMQEPLLEEQEDESDPESPVKRGTAKAKPQDSRGQLKRSQSRKEAAQKPDRVSPSRLQRSTAADGDAAGLGPDQPNKESDV